MPGILRVDQANVDIINAKTTGGKVYIPGHVIQVLQTLKTDTFTLSGTNVFTDITGISLSITPTSTSSRILINTFIPVAVDNGYNVHLRLMRDSTAICIGDASSNRPRSTWQGFFNTNEDQWPVSIQFLDSPATTSAITYKVQMKSGVQCYVNRTSTDRDTVNFDARTASTIIVMEIAQ